MKLLDIYGAVLNITFKIVPVIVATTKPIMTAKNQDI